MSDGAQRLHDDASRRPSKLAGAGGEELARRYGISRATVFRVLERVRLGQPAVTIHALDVETTDKAPSLRDQLAVAHTQVETLRRRIEALRHRVAVVRYGTLQDLVYWIATEHTELEHLAADIERLPERHREMFERTLSERRQEVEAFWTARARESLPDAESGEAAEWIARQLEHDPCPQRWLFRRLQGAAQDDT